LRISKTLSFAEYMRNLSTAYISDRQTFVVMAQTNLSVAEPLRSSTRRYEDRYRAPNFWGLRRNIYNLFV